jgi:S1-C subfamily serine protease
MIGAGPTATAVRPRSSGARSRSNLATGVASASAAPDARRRAGELITAINGTAIPGPSALVAAIAAHNQDQRLTRRGAARLKPAHHHRHPSHPAGHTPHTG